MNLSVIFSILLARRGLFLGVLGGVLAATLAVSLIMPKTYLGEASVVINSHTTDPITGTPTPGVDTASTIVATQTDVITSRNVALKVVDRLNVAKDPDYLKKFMEATDGIGSARIWLADYLSARVTVVPSKESDVLTIDFPAHTAKAAAAFANAFTEAYIQTSLELAADPAQRQAKWFDQETSDLRHRVDLAQQHLSDEQRKLSIVGTEVHVDVDTTRFTEISTQLGLAQQALYESRTRLKQINDAIAKQRLDELPDILGNPLLQTLKTDLARAESNFADVSSRYDHNHPLYVSGEAAVRSLRQKLSAEIGTVRGSMDYSAQMAQRQVAQLQAALDQQKQAVINAKREHDALDVLNHELLSAQGEYDAAMARTNQVRLTGELNQSSIAVLNPAIEPFNPSRPKLLLYMVIAFFFGSCLAAGICLAAEARNRRVRTRSDVVQFTGLLVLAEVPRPGRHVRLA
jgi:chain length determinant protein EpsF